MPKKDTSDMPPLKGEKPTVEHKKLTPKQKKIGHEIDEIFLSKRTRKKEDEQVDEQKDDASTKLKKMKKKKKRKVHEEDAFVDPPSRPRKKTQDGLAIYTEEELGFGKSDAGSTALCPFDCSCCF